MYPENPSQKLSRFKAVHEVSPDSKSRFAIQIRVCMHREGSQKSLMKPEQKSLQMAYQAFLYNLWIALMFRSYIEIVSHPLEQMGISKTQACTIHIRCLELFNCGSLRIYCSHSPPPNPPVNLVSLSGVPYHSKSSCRSSCLIGLCNPRTPTGSLWYRKVLSDRRQSHLSSICSTVWLVQNASIWQA